MTRWLPAWLQAQLESWRTNYRLYRTLFPLWWALTAAGVPLLHERRHGPIRDAIRVRYLRYRLYRRTVEILDCLLVLQPYRHSADEIRVQDMIIQASPGGADRSALAAAWRIKYALDRHHRGDRAAEPASPHTIDQPATATPGQILPWLVRVAAAYVTITRPDSAVLVPAAALTAGAGTGRNTGGEAQPLGSPPLTRPDKPAPSRAAS